jgi:hypothetical protein
VIALIFPGSCEVTYLGDDRWRAVAHNPATGGCDGAAATFTAPDGLDPVRSLDDQDTLRSLAEAALP